jgi:hypothetical protein
MTEENLHQPGQDAACSCFTEPHKDLVSYKELGMDDNYAVVSLLACPACGQVWLKYFYELEAFTASGRWYLGAVKAEQASLLAAGQAKAVLESLGWYFYGGSYFGGRSGRASGRIYLSP